MCQQMFHICVYVYIHINIYLYFLREEKLAGVTIMNEKGV